MLRTASLGSNFTGSYKKRVKSYKVLVKLLSSTADNPVPVQEEESPLNSILMLVDCVGERWTLEVVLRFMSWNLVIAPLVLLQSTAVVCSYGKMIVKVVVCGEDYGLELRGEHARKFDSKDRDWQFKKWLLTGYWLKVATNCPTLWNQKLWCRTLFLHKNDEAKNSSDLQFKA